jgi:DNA gyrase subunit A
MTRAAQGVRGMTLSTDDHLVGMEVLSHGQTLFAATENGYGKRTAIEEYPLRRRGGKGVITIKTNERNGRVVAILLVEEDDDLMLMTDRGKIIRMPVSSISVISRNTQGVKLMNLEPGEHVAGAARLAEKEEELVDEKMGEEGGTEGQRDKGTEAQRQRSTEAQRDEGTEGEGDEGTES